jgi:hypothetical protein
MRKLRTTLQDGKEKYNGSKKMAVQVLAALTRTGECLMEVSPAYGWIGQRSGSGFSDMPRPTLGAFASLDRF